MQIKSLKISNIRSYIDEVIEFPSGTTLLSGDIGVGKSTILLAIEFALFGITKEMPGSALLRNGTNKGSVELHFQVADKDVVVRRALKRGASVTQDAGSITVNNATKEATATELKQNIISLLNYPQELLTKAKSLVYRYTVYTPQEEMKNILVGSKEDRLNTLRRVFGIDKYKIIKENAETVIAKIKTRNREYAIAIADLETQRDEAKKIENATKDMTKAIEKLIPAVEQIKTKIRESKSKSDILEKKIKEVHEIRKNVELCEAKINHKLEESKKNKERIKQIEESIKRSGEELKEEPKAIDSKSLVQKEKELLSLERQERELANKAQELITSRQHALKIIEDITKLDVCPVCKQNVGKEHTEKVKTGEEKKIAACTTQIAEIKKEEERKEKAVKRAKEEITRMKEGQQKAALFKVKKETLEERKKELRKVQEQNTEIKKEIGAMNTIKAELLAKISVMQDTEEQYHRIKKEIETAQEKERELEIAKATKEKEKENSERNLKRIWEDIIQKTKIREKIAYFKHLQEWLEKHFINMTLTMEKKIMLKVHNDFNALFQKWFEMLIDTETIKVKIDEEFSPLIEQNGHNIDYWYLSGGEKTAAALAYRLALNQVINTIVSTIRTKDILILDEPTDGFSSEQLDRLRHVLEELDAKQIIVVSHENKIESFVENVIKLEKKEHTSSIIYP